jgi:hypothetical protein
MCVTTERLVKSIRNLETKYHFNMQKILFNSKYGLEQAVLDGRKTMTRRATSPNVLEKYHNYERWYHSGNIFGELKDEKEYITSNLAPYKVGEVVAIAQSYETMWNTRNVATQAMADWLYGNYYGTYPWTNKMYVKAEYMRHHIKITDIKVEQLQDISDEDCLREGIIAGKMTAFTTSWFKTSVNSFRCYGIDGDFISPREAFAALIDKVGRKGTWEKNPYVFVYEFKLID